MVGYMYIRIVYNYRGLERVWGSTGPSEARTCCPHHIRSSLGSGQGEVQANSADGSSLALAGTSLSISSKQACGLPRSFQMSSNELNSNKYTAHIKLNDRKFQTYIDAYLPPHDV